MEFKLAVCLHSVAQWSVAVNRHESSSINIIEDYTLLSVLKEIETYFSLYFYVLFVNINFKVYKMQLHSFAKILVIEPIADVYGESNERQLCTEIDQDSV